MRLKKKSTRIKGGGVIRDWGGARPYETDEKVSGKKPRRGMTNYDLEGIAPLERGHERGREKGESHSGRLQSIVRLPTISSGSARASKKEK